jgi:hypothetical protein
VSIKPLTGPCWVIADQFGESFEIDTHFESEARALEAVTEHQAVEDEAHPERAMAAISAGSTFVPQRRVYRAVLREFWCLTMTCDECGYELDADGDGIYHGSAQELQHSAMGCEWTHEDGRDFCPADDCAEAFAVAGES